MIHECYVGGTLQGTCVKKSDANFVELVPWSLYLGSESHVQVIRPAHLTSYPRNHRFGLHSFILILCTARHHLLWLTAPHCVGGIVVPSVLIRKLRLGEISYIVEKTQTVLRGIKILVKMSCPRVLHWGVRRAPLSPGSISDLLEWTVESSPKTISQNINIVKSTSQSLIHATSWHPYLWGCALFSEKKMSQQGMDFWHFMLQL